MNLKRLRKKARSSRATPSDPMNVGASMMTPLRPALHLLHGQIDGARVRRVGPGLSLFIDQGLALQREEGCSNRLASRFVEAGHEGPLPFLSGLDGLDPVEAGFARLLARLHVLEPDRLGFLLAVVLHGYSDVDPLSLSHDMGGCAFEVDLLVRFLGEEGTHLDLELVVFGSRLGNPGKGGNSDEANPGKHEDEQVSSHGYL